MLPMLLMWTMREENNHGFDPRAIATSLIAMSNLGETQALEVNLAKHDQNNMNNMNVHVAFEILDIVYLILMHVGIVIFLYVLHKVTIWIAEMINKNYINKKACNSILCKAWNEQTDIYLQVAVKSCQTSLKCYLGTFLGAPSEIEINNLTDPIKISLIKGFIKDKIAIDWTINLTHQLKYTSITCEGEKFYLPDRIKVPLPQKLLGRHLFSKKDANMMTSLVMVYGNEIMVKGLNVNKASSTFNFDVETGLATISDTLKMLKSVPCASKEGGEVEIKDSKHNFDRNDGKRSSVKMMKVKCIHCNENTYVKENPLAANEFEMVEHERK